MGLWGGRFSEPTGDDLRVLNDSISFDIRLAFQDIKGSMAYAQALEAAKVITREECGRIRGGLEMIRREFEEDRFEIAPDDEDIHTAVERRLIELVGPVGGKLHTGRSRNDQVATDLRLWVMYAIDEIDGFIHQVQVAVINQAQAHTETLIPGYTHLQPAQPITVAHWLMSFFWMLSRDRDRLREARRRTSVSPLGSGALAGTPFAINRGQLAKHLGFSSHSQNSLDAVSDRDFVADTLYSLALMNIHLSRFAEDIIIYSNPLFGYITLHDRYSTGSSLMPQKRNADPMELTRGKSGRLIGHLTGLLTTLKGLPSGYNKDLQEDKEMLFDAVDIMKKLLPVISGVIQTLQLNPQKMKEALEEELLATDLADYLVKRGMPFRQAHHTVGQVVQLAGHKQQKLSEISLEALKNISDLFEDDVHKVFNFQAAVSRKRSVGGTAPDSVRKQIEIAKSQLEANTL